MKVGDLVSCSDNSSGPVGVVVKLIEIKGLCGQSVQVFVDNRVVSYLAKDLWAFYESR